MLKSDIKTSIAFFAVSCFIFVTGFYILYNNPPETEAFVFDFGPPVTGDNVSGFAWNDSIGWISFNAADCDLDSDGSFGDIGAPTACPSVSPPVAHDYGVKIDLTTGSMSGYAWSTNAGWISFEESNTPDNNIVLANCVASCDPTVNCTACYNGNDNKLYGWAKVLSLGESGWIRLDDHNGATVPNYGISINPTTSEVSGWAYNEGVDGIGVGWISFNCVDDSICVTSDYKVLAEVNRAPLVTNLKAPNWTYACSGASLENGFGEVRGGWLNWDFDDPDIIDFEEFYRVVLIDVSDGSFVFDTGKCDHLGVLEGGGVGVDCRIADGVGHFPIGYAAGNITELSTGESYQWRVEVWDDKGASSGLVAFDQSVSGHELVDGEDDGDDLTFTVYYNQFPIPAFSWLPSLPSKGEYVTFRDRSSFDDGQAEHNNIDWEFSNGNMPQDASTTFQVFNTDNFSATSTVTDSNGYTCSTSTLISVPVNYELPRWEESK